MIDRILMRLGALPGRKSASLPTVVSDEELTTEEHDALMKALNPTYRAFCRSESGRMVDMALDEEGREI